MSEEKIYDCFYEVELIDGNICTNAKCDLCGRICNVLENKCKFYRNKGTEK